MSFRRPRIRIRTVVLVLAFALPALLAAAAALARGTAAAPENTSPPTIAGTARQGQQLQVSSGTWTGAQPISFRYEWDRCPGTGTKVVVPPCTAIPTATSTTYVPSAADVGRRLRVRLTATNSAGSTVVFTALTDLIGPAQGGSHAIDISQVEPPDRLIPDLVSFVPARITARTPFTMRVRVVDDQGFLVSGALVYVVGLPYDRLAPAPEATSGPDGYATLTLTPTVRLPLSRGSLVLFVRVRKAGDPLLAGVSNRRLVQVGVGP
jgi:hypothetical protein